MATNYRAALRFLRMACLMMATGACAERHVSAQTVTWMGTGSNAYWSTGLNWSGTWTSGTGVNLVVGAGFGSGASTVQNLTNYSSGIYTGAQIGNLALNAPTPFSIYGNSLFLNGSIHSSGSAARSLVARVLLQRPETTVNVVAGSGALTLGTIENVSGAHVTMRKTGGGELALTGNFLSSGSAQPSTFVIQQGTVTMGGALRQGFVVGASMPLGQSGNGSFTAGLLRLEGGALRTALPTGAMLNPQYYTAAVMQDTILSGSNASIGDPTGLVNARVLFTNGFKLESDSRLAVHNETSLRNPIQGSHSLTVTGAGRLNLLSSGSSSSQPLSQLIIDGGGVGVTSNSVLPVNGLTLRNGGRLDSLTGYTMPAGRKIVIEGSGVLRTASPMSAADMVLGNGQLEGSGTLRIESTKPQLPPNMPAGYYIQPGRVRITGSNMAFTGNTVVNGGELVIGNLRGLGSTFIVGGTQTALVQSGVLTLTGTSGPPDLSRVVVNKGGTLKFSGGANVVLTATTAPIAPIAGMVGLEYATLSGSGAALRVANGAIIQNSGVTPAPATLACNVLYTGSENGTLTLAGTYIPNRRFTWGGELSVTGQLQRAEGAGSLNLLIKGAGVNMNVAQQTFDGETTIENGRLALNHTASIGMPGTNRTVLIKEGAQLDLVSGAFNSLGMLPNISGSSAGMIGFGGSVPNEVVRTMARGVNSIGSAYYHDYIYSSALPLESVNGIYRFGTVTTGSQFSPNWQLPRSFTITQPNVLTGSAAVVVGGIRGDAFGTASSALKLSANQDFTGGVTVRKDFFLTTDQSLASPFGAGNVVVHGRLMATGSNGSFVNLANPGQVSFAKGGELWLDNSAGANGDRWGDDTPIMLDSGAVRLSGRPNVAVSETAGTLSYSGGTRIYLDSLNSGSTTALTVKSLAPIPGSHATLEIFKNYGTEKLYVTEAPTMAGAANLVLGVIDRRNNAFVTWSGSTKELAAASPNTNSLAGATPTAYVGLTTLTTATSSASMLALRTTASILTTSSNSNVALTIGNGTVAQIMAPQPGTTEIRPHLVFNGEGVIFTGSSSRTILSGMVTATNGLIKLGPGDLVLSNTSAPLGGSMQDLRIREGRLSGSGSRMWNVIIEGTGVFAPGNSPDISEVGGLTMTEGTGYEFELSSLDAISDKIIVTGDLTLDGFIDVIDWEVDGVGSMEIGTYDLITWGGSLINNGVELRDLPEGFDAYLNLDSDQKVLQLVVVPEPTTMLLAAVGIGLVIARRRKRDRFLPGLAAGLASSLSG